MEDSSPVNTPMVVGCKLGKNDMSPDVDQRTYRSMIGSLLYITTSRPDIMQAVGMVGRYQSAPKQSVTYPLWHNKYFSFSQGTESPKA
jgi:hypothetical protein